MLIPQLGIMVFGCAACFLVGSTKHNTRRWAYLLGLCSQPFWYWSAYMAGQWGILILSTWYTFSWARGAYNHWIKNEES